MPYYHATKVANAKKILKSGLMSDHGRVYATDDARHAVVYPLNKYWNPQEGDKADEQIALVVVNDKAAKLFGKPVNHVASTHHQNIPPELIDEIRVYNAKDFEGIKHSSTWMKEDNPQWPAAAKTLGQKRISKGKPGGGRWTK